jgi:hypothetical protein
MDDIFSERISELAARVHGDPNIVHYMDNDFGKQIAPGLQQVQGFIAMYGWKPGKRLEVTLPHPLVVPNPGVVYDEVSLHDDKETFAGFSIDDLLSPEIPDRYKFSCSYRFGGSNSPEDIEEWDSYSTIHLPLVSRTIPETKRSRMTLKIIASVGVSANVFVRWLATHPIGLEDLYFPKAQETGENEVVEKKLVLYMGRYVGDNNGIINEIELGVHPARRVGKREIVATVSETHGLYSLEMYLTKMKRGALQKMLDSI